jgi:hypothetical protein
VDLSVNWNSIFVPAIGLAEIFVRGSLMYLGLFIILRFMARRQAGHFGPADLLVIVLIADTRPYLTPPSLPLIRDGEIIPQNLRKEMITEDELKSQLREQSVKNFGDIRHLHRGTRRNQSNLLSALEMVTKRSPPPEVVEACAGKCAGVTSR